MKPWCAAPRQNLIDPAAPNPSVEALLHAFLPHTFVDHTHAVALLVLADQPDGAAICREVYGDRVALVPYVMPGLALALAAARAAGVELEGMVLLQHGLFSFGATARQSYERMIALVRQAEERIHQAHSAKPPSQPAPVPEPAGGAAALLPVLRGALARAAEAEGAPARWVLARRGTPLALSVVNDPRLADWGHRSVATPDHVIRTKAFPLVLPADAGAAQIEQALAAYIWRYKDCFSRQNARAGGVKKPLDPLPRLVAIPGLGLVAETVGRFAPANEADTFDMEYWSLEQAKLGKGSEKPLARQVVLVSGGAGAIGAATAEAIAAGGGAGALGIGCDLTDPSAVRQAFAAACIQFGGLDIVVSNAGAAWTGAIA